MTENARRSAAAVQARVPGFVPRVGIVLGSGLGGFAERIEDAVAIPYGDLPGFPRPSVHGHAGRMVLGSLGGQRVVCLQGRVHLYEGTGPEGVKTLVRTLKLLGCEILVLTNAAGSLRRDVGPGSLMAISDHINLLGTNPLVGPNDDDFGPRFPPMADAWDPALRAVLGQAAARRGVALAEGVYCALLGPAFETPAEVRMVKLLGADAVGMSTVPECIVARHCGLRVVGCAVITNLGVGLDDGEVSHAQTLNAAAGAAGRLEALLTGFLEALDP
ncbi:purine-nucleoside phosphorylase [Arenibaculum pallidiluteum]|uniref:purine-nucleoside phosphorylase n=1 Tax=Arenibaculum pallidiluteum TaxID=2812559 RepID=UPI001A95F207|nr:purine-nucleoside phosphorylase [Arenibaculum pallidiluteum]